MSLVPSWDRQEVAAVAVVVAVVVVAAVAVAAVVAVVGINTRLRHLKVPSFSLVKAISPPHRRSRSHPLQMDNTVISKSYNTHHPTHLPTTSLSRRHLHF